MKTFYGIADAHGIESFIPEEQAKGQLGMLLMRANLNRQRHACFFKAECKDLVEKAIRADCKAGDYAGALNMLKLAATVSVHEDHAKSWELIPNPKLDPWG